MHLEGSIRPGTLLAMRRRRGEDAGEGARRRLAQLYEHRDFPHFLSNFRDVCAHLRAPEDYALATEALGTALLDDGVRYAEVFCSPQIAARVGGPPTAEILDAIGRQARRVEAGGGPRMRFLLDGVRQFGIAAAEELVTIAAAAGGSGVIGIGIGGDERSFPTSAFADVYAEARRLGLRTTVHAGEFDGPRSVWEAVETLRVERIGHGIRAIEDPVLVETLRRAGTPLECCPTSNIRTGIVRAWADHPLPALHRAGVAVTVNSDDPAMFGSTVAREWEVLSDRLGLDDAEVLEVALCTVRATSLPDADKEALAADLRHAAGPRGAAS